jgi:hypothetical protein
MITRTERFYCHDAECQHFEGIDVPILSATEHFPAEPYLDLCPECDGELHLEGIPYENLEDLIQRSYSVHAPQQLDVGALSNAIILELERQRIEENEYERALAELETPTIRAWTEL